MSATKQDFQFVLRRQLKTHLQLRSLTARQLAIQAGVPYTTLANWLEGRMPRNIDQLKRVAAYLGLSLDALCYQVSEGTAPASTVLQLMACEGLAGLFEIRLRKILKE